MGKIDGGLRSLFREHLIKFDWTSIESGLTSAGIPDSNFCRDGEEGWIEFKRATGWAVTLEPEQVGWICRRVRYGGGVWIGVRQQAPAGPRREARDALWLIPGALAREAKVGGLRAMNEHTAAMGRYPLVQVWQGGPAVWAWDAVGAALVAPKQARQAGNKPRPAA